MTATEPTSPPLGEAYDPLGVHLHDPYPFYEQARHEEPVFFSKVLNAWVLTRYDDVREALRTPEVFSSANALRPVTPVFPAAFAEMGKGYPFTPHVLNSDGETHKRLRAPLSRALSPARVDAMEPFIRQRAEELVDAFVAERDAGGGQPVDMMERFANRLPVDVISRVFDLAAEDVQFAFEHSYAASRLLFAGVPEPEQIQSARSYVALQHMAARYLHERRARPGDDLVSEIVTTLAPGQDPLPPEQEAQLVYLLSGVFIAGHVTSASLIGNALRILLAGDRAHWELLLERPELIERAAEEVLRFDGPTQGFLRVTTQPVTIGGVELPQGAEVFLLYASANRDETFTDRPDTFDPTRAPTRHLAFAIGVHACAGAGLARRELVVTLQTLTRRLPALRLVEPQDFGVRRTLGGRGPVRVLVTW